MLKNNLKEIAVIGQGYVGLPLAIRAAEVGYLVYGVEKEKRRLELLKQGTSYIGDISSEIVQKYLDRNYFPIPPEELKQYDVAVITVPTPLHDGEPDLSYVIDAVDLLGRSLRKGALVILESTTYPGTTEEILCPRLEQATGLIAGIDFYVGYSPERIDPGNKIWQLSNTPKIISGINKESLERVRDFYSKLVQTVVVTKGTKEAELAKLLENTFRQVNIALVNELMMHTKQLDVDIWNAIEAAATKPFGFMPFYPGPGVGGHCLPVDPVYLSWKIRNLNRQGVRLVELANEINSMMPDFVIKRVTEILNNSGKSVKGSKILCYGLAYKADTSDLRESPAYEVVLELLRLGAEIKVIDGFVNPSELDPLITLISKSEANHQEYDLVAILTDHSDIDYNNLAKEARQVLDTRHIVSGDNVHYL
jgi:UDP-N-acetyl-D-glucosamine dehydrogenase